MKALGVLAGLSWMAICFWPGEGRACTAFLLADGDKRVVGKSYDWDIAVGRVLFNKRGVVKQSAPVGPGDLARWTSRYASLTFNQYGREFPNGGINEAGLVVEVLWLSSSQYPPPDQRPVVNELQWIQYQLDNFATVAEAVSHSGEVRLASLYGKVHYFVCDRGGSCAAFESLGGKLVVTAGDRLLTKTLANDSYAESLAFLEKHQGFGGSVPIPQGSESMERFARAASLAAGKAGSDLNKRAFEILESVAQGDYSKWNIVYDLGQARVYFRSLGHPQVKVVDLKRFDGSCGSPVLGLDLNTDLEGDVTGQFTEDGFDANLKLLQESMKDIAAKLPPGAVQLMAIFPSGFRCAALDQPSPAASPSSWRRELQGILEMLSSDLFEGRAPGTRGGQLAEAYLESLYKIWGFEPGFQGSYRQPFTLIGYTTRELTLSAAGVTWRLGEDVLGTFAADQEKFLLAAEAVFVGFGIATPLGDWDDFKDSDVRGKLIIARVNDPGLFVDGLFEGKTLTYFGRWTYHVEEALRRGATGILLIHTDQTAGYGWSVVQNSWGGESLHLKDEVNNSLKFRGWVREAALRKLLLKRGFDLEALYRSSLSKQFKPVPLGFTVKIQGKQKIRELSVHNVIAEIPGKSRKHIVLSAHIDHLGKNEALPGDGIFNGAIDNASAVTAMLATARALKARQPDLGYSITVLACQAEESGLLGSRVYVKNTDRENIIADINFESTPVWEKAGSIMGVGASFSTLEDLLQVVARENGWGFSEFSMVDQGFFYRSDQFSFARSGIPALWISAGEDDASGKRKYSTFWKTDYHTVHDEFHADWPLEGLQQTVQAALGLVEQLEKAKEPPRWKRKLTFPTMEP